MHLRPGSRLASLTLCGLATMLIAGPAAAVDEAEVAGQGALQRNHVRNFLDFEDLSLTELLGMGSKLRFSLNIFSAVGADVSLRPTPRTGRFFVTPVFFLATADLEDDITMLAEVGLASTVSVHRIWLRWRGEHVHVRAGRMHTDLGYWNTAYHHGTWLQLTQERPRFLASSGLVYFPIHTEGVEVTGHLPAPGGRFVLVSSLTNGREVAGASSGALRIKDKAVTLGAAYQRDGDLRLRIGVGAFYDRVARIATVGAPLRPNRRVQDILTNAHVVVFGSRLSIIGEAYYQWQKGADSRWTTLDTYLTAGYRALDDWTPYGRIEYLRPEGPSPSPVVAPNISGATPAVPRELLETVVGLRYDTSAWSALRLEYRLGHFLGSGGQDSHAVFLDWSFGL